MSSFIVDVMWNVELAMEEQFQVIRELNVNVIFLVQHFTDSYFIIGNAGTPHLTKY